MISFFIRFDSIGVNLQYNNIKPLAKKKSETMEREALQQYINITNSTILVISY